MRNFEFNEQGVCMNPETVYHFMPKGALTWAYTKVTVAEYNGKWCNGVSHLSGGYGCGISKLFNTKEEAVEYGISTLEKYINTSSLLSDADTKRYIDDLSKWKHLRYQLSMF